MDRPCLRPYLFEEGLLRNRLAVAVVGCHINEEMRVSILRCGGVDKLIGGHIICIDVGNSEH